MIARLVQAARGAGMSDERLYEVLAARTGISGGARLADALRDGRDDYVALGRPRLQLAPMALVSLNAVRKSFGSRTVLDGLDFAVEPGARVGVVGANGSGKSTMLKLIAGLEEPDAGTSVRRRGIVVSFLPQHPLGDERNAARDRARARPDLDELDRDLHRVAEQLAAPELAADLDKMTRVLRRQEELVERWEAPAVRASTAAPRDAARPRHRGGRPDAADERALRRPAQADRARRLPRPGSRTCSCSTSPRRTSTRSAARCSSACSPAFDGAAVAVSHDRYLLDETVSQIAELHRGRIRMWPGNYSAYTLARELELQRQQQQFVTQQKEIERLEAAIRRFKDWAHRVVDERHIKQARNKQRQIDRMEKVERPVLERRKIALRLHPHERGGQRVFELRHVGMQFGDDVVLAGVDLTVVHGERVGFVGANGAGKSVLLKTVVGELEPTEGEVWVGPSIRIGYLAQDQETLDPESSPLETVRLAPPLHRGRGRLAADEVPLPLRAGAPRQQAPLRRRADAAAAAPADAPASEPARARRADEPPRHRLGRGARGGARGVRRARSA